MATLIAARRLAAASLLVGGVLSFGAFVASACGMRWASTPIAAHNLADCFAFANKALTDNSFAAIQQSPSEVKGTKNGSLTAITCFQFGTTTTAVIMVVGDSDATNGSLLSAVETKIKSYTTL